MKAIVICQFNVIAALDRKQGIGYRGKLPWHLPPDLEYFHQMTDHSIVIMGRKTWDSIPQQHRPCETRMNIVLSRHDWTPPAGDSGKGVLLSHSFEQALELAQNTHEKLPIFVMGGGEIYQLALFHPACSKLFLTHIDAEFDCDTFFPEYKNQFVLKTEGKIEKHEGIKYVFCEYEKR